MFNNQASSLEALAIIMFLHSFNHLFIGDYKPW